MAVIIQHHKSAQTIVYYSNIFWLPHIVPSKSDDSSYLIRIPNKYENLYQKKYIRCSTKEELFQLYEDLNYILRPLSELDWLPNNNYIIDEISRNAILLNTGEVIPNATLYKLSDHYGYVKRLEWRTRHLENEPIDMIRDIIFKDNTITIFDRTYNTIKEACQDLGISAPSVYNLTNKTNKIPKSPEEAILTIYQRKTKRQVITIYDKEYTSIKQACSDLHISRSKLFQLKREQNLTSEEAILQLLKD